MLMAGVLALTGCDEDRAYDNKPAEGRGGLVVDNHTDEEMRVYIDGEKLGRVNPYDARYFEVEPGVQRVVVDADEYYRTWRDDVDVVEQRRTVIDIESCGCLSGRNLDVAVYLD